MTQRAIDGPYMYFVTTNTMFRRRFFMRADQARKLGAIIMTACREAEFDLLGYCILPDHIHLVVRKSGSMTLSYLMKRIKGRFWRIVSGGRFWQPRFNFRIIDNEEYLVNVLEYITFNYKKMDLDEIYGQPPFIFVNPYSAGLKPAL